ncbi:transducin family protein [Actinidia rufa]|uniref:Transducin family protein n=1 Tax=Actinidia rufa TaxID=165716 RepID=A0A7J0E1V1_9ERIC|nr:transducin family protein [Actinidia rufa]
MNSPTNDDEEDQGEIFLDESDIIHEIAVDDEDLPDADDEAGSDDAEDVEEVDDSMHIFTGHTGELYAVACSPTDGALVATGGGDDKGFLWKIGQGDWASELQGHKDSVSSLAFSTDGQLLASGSFDRLIQIWDINSGNLKCALEGPGAGIEWVRWHPKGHLVLTGSEDSTVWMWNADKSAYLNMFSGHGSSVTCGDFTPDGKTICTGSDDATLRIWNPRSGENIHVVKGSVQPMIVDGCNILFQLENEVCDASNPIYRVGVLPRQMNHKHIFHAQNGIHRALYLGHPYHTEGLTCLTIASDSTLALTGSKDSSVHIVNIITGKVVSSLSAHSDSIECIGLALSMDEQLPLGLQLNIAACLSSLFGICSIHYPMHFVIMRSCMLVMARCIQVCGYRLCRREGTSVWDSLSGDCVRTFSGHSDAIQSLAVSANGEFLVSVSLDGTARVFEITEFR